MHKRLFSIIKKLTAHYGLQCVFYFFVTLSMAFANDMPQRGAYNHTYWGLDVYHARLFMDKECIYPQCDFILELTYKRDFDGTDIVKRSIEEIHAQHDLKPRMQKKYTHILNKIFPNVTEGDIIQGKMINGYAEFYLNNKFIGKLDDTVLSRHFFDIWLSPKTSEPTMRKKLLQISL